MNEKVFTDQEIEAVVRVIRAGVDSGQSDGSIARAILRHVHGEAGEAVVSNETNAISDPTDLEIDAAEAVLKQAASDWWTNANRADSNPFTLDRTIVRAILRHVRGETGRGIEFMRSEREASRVATREVAVRESLARIGTTCVFNLVKTCIEAKRENLCVHCIARAALVGGK